jgi:transposase-like protein
MAPRKLSDSDKQDITKIYCQPGETTSTVATKFDVSSSTVSRVLKQMLSDDDYGKLMQWKRGGERGSVDLSFDVPAPEQDAEAAGSEAAKQKSPEDATQAAQAEEDDAEVENTSEKGPQRRSRQRSTTRKSSAQKKEEQNEEPSPSESAEDEAVEPTVEPPKVTKDSKKLIKKSDRVNDNVADNNDDVAAWVSEGLAAEDDYDSEEDDDDWDEEEDWDDDSEEDDEYVPQTPRQEVLAILSFNDFAVKKPCYLVVDRLAELITCPLKEFSELGSIPEEEGQARTLPIFDNHRVARRFARRNQRIIKVPNGLMINKTQEYLQAKGITRLLFDGQVYALN